MYLAMSTVLAVYAFLQIRGVCEAFPREPFIALPAAEVEAMRVKLIQGGFLP
jgi:hypothetical protein